MSEVEEIMKRILSHKGVEGVIIANTEGIILRSTLEDQSTVHHVALVQPLLMKAKKIVQDMNPEDELTYVRLRTEKNEEIIAADKDYFMISIQTPSL
ncbi:dynein light chain roadblock-type 1-like isoform X1 [Fundulus heteroclitus]|uniref:dynein light chain roadblock-type 1-like isoform X1 n=2 Tax=Fundulus heteroclitus TaxID=8078 RepID=UPI00165A58B8|nr:dynein light chain roadblock-type 1-like isoform X1 [Fundulus heteroclitus]